jgi:hypothetical protein
MTRWVLKSSINIESRTQYEYYKVVMMFPRDRNSQYWMEAVNINIEATSGNKTKISGWMDEIPLS